MAHLTLRERERGQLLVVTAFALGVLFVALALILNSAIFAENLASRGETTGSDKVVDYRGSLRRGVGAVLAYENRNVTTSHGLIETRVVAATSDISTALRQRSVRQGSTGETTWINRSDGTLIRQNASDDFTDNGSDGDWTLVTSVDRTRAFTMNVTTSELNSTCTRLDDCFNLTVTDGTDEWTVSMNDDGGVAVEVYNGTSAAACDPVDESTVLVDVTGGTVGGSACRALNFSEAPDTGYEIRYENAGRIGGTYSMVVDNSTLVSTDSDSYANATAESPSATPALYDVNLSVEYQTADVVYNSTLRVAPGEPDE